jgi:hypothetical protein
VVLLHPANPAYGEPELGFDHGSENEYERLVCYCVCIRMLGSYPCIVIGKLLVMLLTLDHKHSRTRGTLVDFTTNVKSRYAMYKNCFILCSILIKHGVTTFF